MILFNLDSDVKIVVAFKQFKFYSCVAPNKRIEGRHVFGDVSNNIITDEQREEKNIKQREYNTRKNTVALARAHY